MAEDQIKALHSEHRSWQSQLNFYQDEIKFFQDKLASLAATNAGNEDLEKQIEEYKKKFLDLFTRIDNLRHALVKNEKSLADKLELANRLQEHLTVDDDHHSLKMKMKDFERDYGKLKKKFEQFLSEND